MWWLPFWSKPVTDLKIPPVLKTLNAVCIQKVLSELRSWNRLLYPLCTESERDPRNAHWPWFHTRAIDVQRTSYALSTAEKKMLVQTTVTLDSSCLGHIYPGYCHYIIHIRTCTICYFRSWKLLQAVVKGQDAVELQMVLKEHNSAKSRAMLDLQYCNVIQITWDNLN